MIQILKDCTASSISKKILNPIYRIIYHDCQKRCKWIEKIDSPLDKLGSKYFGPSGVWILLLGNAAWFME